jgi:hypothetical protein
MAEAATVVDPSFDNQTAGKSSRYVLQLLHPSRQLIPSGSANQSSMPQMIQG